MTEYADHGPAASGRSPEGKPDGEAEGGAVDLLP